MYVLVKYVYNHIILSAHLLKLLCMFDKISYAISKYYYNGCCITCLLAGVNSLYLV